MILCEEDSFFQDFYEEDDRVHILCRIYLQNTGDTPRTVKLTAASQEDAEGGLLAAPSLSGVNTGDGTDLFVIGAGETREFIVDFIGTYGGTFRKADRLLPDEIYIEILGHL